MNLEAYNSGVGTGFQPYAYASGATAVLNNRAFFFSPNVGANYQAGNWVLGVEASADLPVGGDEKSVTFATPGLGYVPSVAQMGAGWSLPARRNRQGRLADHAGAAGLCRRRPVDAEDQFERLRRHAL